MPERKHVQVRVTGRVVDEVADAAQEQAPHTRDTRPFVSGPKAGLFCQQGHGFAEVRSNGTGRPAGFVATKSRRVEFQ